VRQLQQLLAPPPPPCHHAPSTAKAPPDRRPLTLRPDAGACTQEGSAVANRVLSISELLAGLPDDLVFVDDGSDDEQ
jgi:hypothetical protein